MLTFDVFAAVARDYSRSATLWLEQLASIPPEQFRALLNQIPPHRISPMALEFAYQTLEFNRSRLLALKKNLT